MALPQPTAVAAAVAGGSPTDVREWIVVDIVGAPSVHRRGYAVLAEPLDGDGRTRELAHQVRDVLVHQLRLHARQSPDAALARAFGEANSVLRDDARATGDAPRQVGATAIVFEESVATIGHVPPGQVILVQDHLVYSLPELDSWLPHWATATDGTPQPEPLGYASWVAPALVQTELLPGDGIVLCNAAAGAVIARAGADASLSLRRFHAQDPDVVLDDLRTAVLAADEPFAAIAVISFPPNPVTSEIETLNDVGRNAREQFRHARAAAASVMPSLPQRARPVDPAGAGEDAAEVAAPIVQLSFQERVLRVVEGQPTDSRATWQPRRPEAMFGAPGAHGVRRHRRITGLGDPVSWKSGVPRAPFITSPLFLGLVLVVVFLLGLLAWNQRHIFLPDENLYVPVLAQVDTRMQAINGMTDTSTILTELNNAQADLDRADALGAPDDQVNQRHVAITLKRDDVSGVVRVDGVIRIGNLPPDLRDGETSAYMTSGGIFMANGNLYRLNPETAEMQMMLQQGREIEDIRVGELFGVAYDGSFLMVTDGRALFFASSTDGAIWQAMTMEEINDLGPWPAGPVSAFNENLYLLVPEYRNIYTFPTDANEQVVAAEDWVLTGDRISLNAAVDMTIDGNIYVLLDDGQVITFRGGSELHRFDLPGFDPETSKPVAIISGSATGYLYVAVEDKDGNGRIIASDDQGENVVILELPVDFSTGGADVQRPFDGLQDIVVDEQLGKLYLINGDAIWSFDYTLPVLPGSTTATPEAGE